MFIYNNSETSFANNGLGYLKDIISASVVDTLNGDYSLTFEYPMGAKLSEYLEEGNYVKCKVADGSYQVFYITNVVKTFDIYKVQAKHVFYTASLDIDYFRDIPSDLDPNFAAALIHCKHKPPKDDSGVYSAILLSLARKEYIHNKQLNL